MKLFSCLSILAITTLNSFQITDNTFTVKDYLTVPGPVSVNKINYSLSWSAHPAATYYKQEYLPVGQKSETYTNMIMIEAVVGDISLQDAVKSEINELDQRKSTDLLANYQIVENKAKGEYLLDFIMSESAGGNTTLAEWDAYRYVPLKDKNGKKGILLFSLSKRGYGTGVSEFLKTLKTERVNDINAIAGYNIPVVTIKN